MWICPVCDESNGDGNTTCFNCKYQLIDEKTSKRMCPKCKTVYRAGTRKCIECGDTLVLYREKPRADPNAALVCPECGSTNVSVQAVAELKATGLFSTVAKIALLGEAQTIAFASNRRKTTTNAYGVCQSCGHLWQV